MLTGFSKANWLVVIINGRATAGGRSLQWLLAGGRKKIDLKGKELHTQATTSNSKDHGMALYSSVNLHINIKSQT